MKRAILIPGLALVALSLAVVACGDPLENYGTCTAVEHARCALREKCLPSFDYATCAAYYDEFCRTRHVNGETGTAPTDAQLQACVTAIADMDCVTLDAAMTGGIDETDLLEACSFAHPKEEPDAGGTDDAADAG
jgi:hypothetical protein